VRADPAVQRPSAAGREPAEPAPEPPADPYELVEHELALLLRRVRALSRTIAREVHPDLDPTAYGLLIRLDETGGARLTDLAAYFGVGKPSLSRQVATLERLGLVSRRDDPADARAARLALTPSAAARLEEVRRGRRGRLRARMRRWPEGDVAELGRLLHRLNAAD
jgi:DNA-binding MarR family transcriptional regulator